MLKIVWFLICAVTLVAIVVTLLPDGSGTGNILLQLFRQFYG